MRVMEKNGRRDKTKTEGKERDRRYGREKADTI
jgi:hypothetical protein